MSDYKFSLFIILGKSVITIQTKPTHLALKVLHLLFASHFLAEFNCKDCIDPKTEKVVKGLIKKMIIKKWKVETK